MLKFFSIHLISLLFLFGCSSNDNSATVYRDGDTRMIRVYGVDMEFVFVEAGTFRQAERRDVTLTRGFWIGRFPVTQAQYQAVMGYNPSRFSIRPNNPVESVNWFDANDFAQTIGGHLPTEAEWEFASRGGNRSRGYVFSGSDNFNLVAWYLDNISKHCDGFDTREERIECYEQATGTRPVGLLQGNELGIHDMSGNVWEWTADWFEGFDTISVTNPTGPMFGSLRIMLGGSWKECVEECGSGRAVAVISNPFNRFDDYGFRVVMNAD
jgi:formylglycine-generating enzyme required for sulfatase activity